MSTHTYTRDTGHGEFAFSDAIAAALPGKAFTVQCSDTDCVIVFEDELTAGEITTLDGVVSGYVSTPNGPPNFQPLLLVSPNGTVYQIEVADNGTLSTTVVP